LFTASKPGGSDTSTSTNKESRKILGDLSEAIRIITSRHVNGDRMEVDSLAKNSITGALQTLDPHSSYFDAGEYTEFLDEQQSEYSGIGATIAGYSRGERSDTYVTSIARNSPASNAGLAFGDRILKVNGEDMAGKSTDDVRDAVRGPVESKVKLLVERNLTGRIETLELRRRLLQQPSIRDSFVLPGDVGYIAMTEGFNYTTASELGAALQNLHRRSIKGLILDLRENPGGILDQAVKVAEKFLPAGSLIVTQKGRSSIDNRVWVSRNRAPETLPLVLLVNEESASASEILAGALQDHDRALIIGEKTFGKGLVQSLYDGPGGTGLTLTTARYFTPSGRSIQRDYSDGGLYDYYNHHTAGALTRAVTKTSANRTVFSGDGIDPDEICNSHQMTSIERKIDDLSFFFIRDLVAGRRKAPTILSTKISNNSVSEELTKSFVNYVMAQPTLNFASDRLQSMTSFISDRLAYNLVMATKGDVQASRISIAGDQPVIKAISQLPKARDLALLNNHYGRQ